MSFALKSITDTPNVTVVSFFMSGARSPQSSRRERHIVYFVVRTPGAETTNVQVFFFGDSRTENPVSPSGVVGSAR